MNVVVIPAGSFEVGGPELIELEASRAPAVFLADAIDPDTGDFASVTRGHDPVDAAALEALRVERSTGSAVMNDGHKLRSIEFVDDTTEHAIREEVKFAWGRLIEARLIEFSRLDVTIDGDTPNVEARFRNLVSGADGFVPLNTLRPRCGS